MKKSVASVILTAALLQGCSGHPGSGHWQANLDSGSLNSEAQYSSLELEFDGKGTLRPNKSVAGQEDKADLWCLWQAKSAIALDVQCGDGSAEKTNLKFEFTVTGGKQEGAFAYTQANLTKEGNVVTVFNRSANY